MHKIRFWHKKSINIFYVNVKINLSISSKNSQAQAYQHLYVLQILISVIMRTENFIMKFLVVLNI